MWGGHPPRPPRSPANVKPRWLFLTLRSTTADAYDLPLTVVSRIHAWAPVAILSDARASRADRLRRFVAPVVASAAVAALVVGAAAVVENAGGTARVRSSCSRAPTLMPALHGMGSTGSARGRRQLRRTATASLGSAVAASARGDVRALRCGCSHPRLTVSFSLGLLRRHEAAMFTIPDRPTSRPLLGVDDSTWSLLV